MADRETLVERLLDGGDTCFVPPKPEDGGDALMKWLRTNWALRVEAASELDRLNAKVEELEREVETQRELKKHARKCCDEEEAKVADLSARLTRAVEVIEPFTSFAEHAVEQVDSWTWRGSQNDRIRDWFGPSDFGAVRAFLSEQESPHG